MSNKSLICECGFIAKTKRGLSCHLKYCDGSGSAHTKRRKNYQPNWTCANCGFLIKNNRARHINSCDGSGPRSKKQRRSRSEAVKLRWEDPDYRIKMEISSQKIVHTGVGATLEIEEERRSKIRAKIIQRYAAGWQPTCGRSKKFDYESHIAGKIKVDGTWELSVCYYLDSINVKWQRNSERFHYKRPDGANATYCPDFFVEEWNAYLEIKGYETDLDRCKWRDFPKDKRLFVWRKEDLLKMKILE